MSVVCPVCKANCGESSAQKCGTCGFDDLHRTFINVDDGNYWLETVVYPQRIKWEADRREAALAAQLEQARQREATLMYHLEQAQDREEALSLKLKQAQTRGADLLLQLDEAHQREAELEAQLKQAQKREAELLLQLEIVHQQEFKNAFSEATDSEDKEGRKFAVIEHDRNGKPRERLFVFDANGNLKPHERPLAFDSDGKLIPKTGLNGDNSTESAPPRFLYDENGKLIENPYYSDNSSKSATTKGGRIGRNDPCPCGKRLPNGLPMKYKNCCGKG